MRINSFRTQSQVQADLLGRSLDRGSLDLYAAEHEKTLRAPRRMARALLLMDRHASLRIAAMHGLANSPGSLFSVTSWRTPHLAIWTPQAISKTRCEKN